MAITTYVTRFGSTFTINGFDFLKMFLSSYILPGRHPFLWCTQWMHNFLIIIMDFLSVKDVKVRMKDTVFVFSCWVAGAYHVEVVLKQFVGAETKRSRHTALQCLSFCSLCSPRSLWQLQKSPVRFTLSSVVKTCNFSWTTSRYRRKPAI